MTAVLDACPDLRALTDEELAAAYGADDADLDALLAEERRRESERRAKAARLAARRARQQQWFEAAWQQHRAAETACNGVLLSKAGLATGMDPFALWSGPQSQADRYASWELQEFWQSSPRITVTEWQRQERRERGTDDHAMDRDEPGSVQPGSPAAAAGTVPGTGPVRDTGHVRSGPGGDMITGQLTLATPFAEVDAVPAEAVWDGRIPGSELTIMAALGGTGKGMLACDLAARISTGAALPGDDREPDQPASVLIISAEDDRNAVTVKRLRAAGADMARVYDLSVVDGAPFELPAHLPALRQAIDEIPECKLVILDPLAGVAPVSLTAVRQVRAILSPLRRIAQDTGCAILITHHLTKGREVAGSRAVVDGVRSVLMVERDPADESVRCVTVAKSNMGPGDMPPVRYKIAATEDGGAVVAYLDGEQGKTRTGQERILDVLAAEPKSGQAIAKETEMPYSTVRVLLARLIAAGKAGSPMRGWFARPVVTSSGNGSGESQVRGTAEDTTGEVAVTAV